MYDKGKGTSKHYDKRNDKRAFGKKIYTDNTMDQYVRHWDDFCASARAAGFKSDTPLERLKEYIPSYIKELSGREGKRPGTTMSAWSVRAYAAAALKVFGESAKDYDLPARHRADIFRSRYETIGDKHFSVTKNAELINFCECTGLRSIKELQTLKGFDLIPRGNGQYAITVQEGKGGKYREVPVMGTPEQVKAVVDRMRDSGTGKVWTHVHSNADIHSYRATYACRMYESVARNPKTLPFQERYCCRGDMKGVWYDREAMKITSLALGHERYDVIAEHYLWRL